jgi:hypothetical protein
MKKILSTIAALLLLSSCGLEGGGSNGNAAGGKYADNKWITSEGSFYFYYSGSVSGDYHGYYGLVFNADGSGAYYRKPILGDDVTKTEFSYTIENTSTVVTDSSKTSGTFGGSGTSLTFQSSFSFTWARYGNAASVSEKF